MTRPVDARATLVQQPAALLRAACRPGADVVRQLMQRRPRPGLPLPRPGRAWEQAAGPATVCARQWACKQVAGGG